MHAARTLIRLRGACTAQSDLSLRCVPGEALGPQCLAETDLTANEQADLGFRWMHML